MGILCMFLVPRNYTGHAAFQREGSRSDRRGLPKRLSIRWSFVSVCGSVRGRLPRLVVFEMTEGKAVSKTR